MTREAEMDAWTLFREVRRALRASGMRKPYWRVFKRELPGMARAAVIATRARPRLHGTSTAVPRVMAGVGSMADSLPVHGRRQGSAA